MIMNKIALDTNILIYSHDKNDMRKQDIARTLLDLSPLYPRTKTFSVYARGLLP